MGREGERGDGLRIFAGASRVKQHGEVEKTKKRIRWWFQIFFKAILEMMIPIGLNLVHSEVLVQISVPSTFEQKCHLTKHWPLAKGVLSMKTAHKNRWLDLVGERTFPVVKRARWFSPGPDMSVSSSSRGLPVGRRRGAG